MIEVYTYEKHPKEPLSLRIKDALQVLKGNAVAARYRYAKVDKNWH